MHVQYRNNYFSYIIISTINCSSHTAGVPAPSVSGPILVPSSPPYTEAVSEPAGASGMDSEQSKFYFNMTV